MDNLHDLSAVEAMLYGDVEGDADLEAELLALQEEDDEEPKARPKQPNSRPKQPNPGPKQPNSRPVQSAPPGSRTQPPRPPRGGVDLAEIDRLARRISEEANVDDDDDDDTVDDDPDLLDELNGLVGHIEPQTHHKSPDPSHAKNTTTQSVDMAAIHLVEERLSLYKTAESHAKSEGNAANARRYARGINTLQTQLKTLKCGGSIDEQSMPPMIVVKNASNFNNLNTEKDTCNLNVPDHKLHPSGHSAPALPSESEQKAPKVAEKPGHHRISLPPQNTETGRKKVDLKDNSSDIRLLSERRDGYKKLATQCLRVGDKEKAQWAYKICKQFDAVISAAEAGQSVDMSNMPKPAPAPPPSPSVDPPKPVPQKRRKSEDPSPAASSAESSAAPSAAPSAAIPKTILEGLEQRLAKYKESAAKATETGDDRKARMMGRIGKQYQDAIRAHKAGRAVDFEELPCPPGCGPLPIGTAGTKPAPPLPVATAEAPTPQAGPTPQPRAPGEKSPAAGKAPGPGPPVKLSRQEQQLQTLMQRQMQFKKEALLAKKRGDVEKAKELLRQAKGFDQMIEASKAGLPVNVGSTPAPPQTTTSLKSTMAAEAETQGWSVIRGNRETVYVTLEKDLIRQIQICQQNMEYFSKLGDVRHIDEFEKLAAHNKRDLVALRQSFKFNDPPPRFKYVMKSFPSLQCNPDLPDDILELMIVRGLQIRLAEGYDIKDSDLFVKYEFPFPQEAHQTGKSGSMKGTCSPVFNEVVKLKINRTSRQMLRVFKRNGIKLEVFQKGTWIRSDKLMGSCEVKLAQLESKASQHVSVDLMEGRKACGGKMEVKMRIKTPIVQQTAEVVKEKCMSNDIYLSDISDISTDQLINFSNSIGDKQDQHQFEGPPRRDPPPGAVRSVYSHTKKYPTVTDAYGNRKKIRHYCTVQSCVVTEHSRKHSTNEKYKFYRVPTEKKDPLRRKLWVDALRPEQPDWDPSQWTRICELHFEGGDPGKTGVPTLRLGWNNSNRSSMEPCTSTSVPTYDIPKTVNANEAITFYANPLDGAEVVNKDEFLANRIKLIRNTIYSLQVMLTHDERDLRKINPAHPVLNSSGAELINGDILNMATKQFLRPDSSRAAAPSQAYVSSVNHSINVTNNNVGFLPPTFQQVPVFCPPPGPMYSNHSQSHVHYMHSGQQQGSQ